MGSFTKWIENKLEDRKRAELLDDLLSFMDEDERADLVEELVTELNDDGYDWGDEPPVEPATKKAPPPPAPSDIFSKTVKEPSDNCVCYDCTGTFKRSEVRPQGTAYICFDCDENLNILPTEER